MRRAMYATAHGAMLRVSEYTGLALLAGDVEFAFRDGALAGAKLTLRDCKTSRPGDPITRGVQHAFLAPPKHGQLDALGWLYAYFLSEGLGRPERRHWPIFAVHDSEGRRLPLTAARVNAWLRADLGRCTQGGER